LLYLKREDESSLPHNVIHVTQNCTDVVWLPLTYPHASTLTRGSYQIRYPLISKYIMKGYYFVSMKWQRGNLVVHFMGRDYVIYCGARIVCGRFRPKFSS